MGNVVGAILTHDDSHALDVIPDSIAYGDFYRQRCRGRAIISLDLSEGFNVARQQVVHLEVEELGTTELQQHLHAVRKVLTNATWSKR